MTLAELLPLLLTGIPGIIALYFLWRKQPTELRALSSGSEKTEADADKVRAETITMQNATIAGMSQQISTMNGVIFGMQNTLNEQTNKINLLNAKVVQQDTEIARLNTGNENLMGEVASGRTREDELKKLVTQQRALIDSLPARLDLLEATLLKEGIVLPRDKAVDTARAAIDKQEGKVAGTASTTQAQDAAKIAIEAVATAIDETKKPPPDTPQES